MAISISHTTRKVPHLPFKAIKDAVLGSSYDLSLTFVGRQRARTLNMKHRGKMYVPNVLSFPLEKNAGEIYIAPEVARSEASRFSLSEQNYLALLFIHGLLHLKGHHHGATMEKAEKRYLKRFGFLG